MKYPVNCRMDFTRLSKRIKTALVYLVLADIWTVYMIPLRRRVFDLPLLQLIFVRFYQSWLKNMSRMRSRFRIILNTANGVVVIIQQPFPPISRDIYKKGVNVITSDLTRNDPRRKDLNFIGESQSERSRVGKDVYEVLLTKNRRIYEGMTSNFYIVKYGGRDEATPDVLPGRYQSATLVTARDGILLGVTRRAILRLARGQGMSINYRLPSLCESFSEAFISSSSRGVVPVVAIDGDRVGEGRVGIWTRRLI